MFSQISSNHSKEPVNQQMVIILCDFDVGRVAAGTHECGAWNIHASKYNSVFFVKSEFRTVTEHLARQFKLCDTVH